MLNDPTWVLSKARLQRRLCSTTCIGCDLRCRAKLQQLTLTTRIRVEILLHDRTPRPPCALRMSEILYLGLRSTVWSVALYRLPLYFRILRTPSSARSEGHRFPPASLMQADTTLATSFEGERNSFPDGVHVAGSQTICAPVTTVEAKDSVVRLHFSTVFGLCHAQ